MKPNRLTVRHITNMTNAVDDITSLLGSWNDDKFLKDQLEKIIKDDKKIEKLHEAIKYLDTIAQSFHEIEIN